MLEVLARTLRGIEWIAAAEIRAVLGVSEIAHGHRELRFSVPKVTPALLALGTVDDVFLVVAAVEDVGGARKGLAALAGAARRIDLDLFSKRVNIVRAVAGRSFDVVGSFLGERNFSRFELEDAFGTALAPATGWSYLSRSAGDPARGALSLRIHVDGSRATVAVRIAATPLHRRGYRVASRPGSLHPPLARALALLAGLRPGESLVDPFCGAGTVPIEARLACPGIGAAGFDLDEEAIATARRNSAAAGLDVAFAPADAANLPLDVGSVDRVAANPPWGSAVALRGDPIEVNRELLRILAQGGRVALIGPPARDLPRGLEVLVEERVRVSGAVASIVVLARPGSGKAPFDGASLYGRELIAAASSPRREPSL
jgi:23S rRNA G2445 N2-methylase RlmL